MKLSQSIRFKITTLASISFAIVYIIVLSYLGIKLKKQAYTGAISEIQSISNQKSAIIKQYLENFMSDNRVLGQIFESHKHIAPENRRTSLQHFLKKVLIENPNMLAAWTIWEPNALDSLDYININKPGCTQIGSFATTYYKDDGEIKLENSSYEGELFVGDYYTIPKKTMNETIMDSYYYSYTGLKQDEIIQTSTIVPISIDGNFKGVVGFDISLANFKPLVDSMIFFKTGYSVIITNSGSIVAHPDKKMVGKNMFTNNKQTVIKQNIRHKIAKGKAFCFIEEMENTSKPMLVHFTPFSIGKSTTNWSLVSIIPIDEINSETTTAITVTALLGIIGIFVMMIIGWIVIGKITTPLSKISDLIKNLNNADLEQIKTISKKFKNEVGEIAKSTYTLINWLNDTGKFATEIKDGNYETKYKLLNKNDTLGESLLEMRDHLAKAGRDDNDRATENKRHIWHSDGLSKIGSIISQNNDSIESMTSYTIKYVTDYIEASQGGFFILNEENKSDIYYELLAAVAYGREKITNKEIRIGEGLVGRCAYEKLPIILTEIPQNYLKITSGLGTANPNCILLMPIILNNVVYGVIELASFNTFEKYQIDFIEKICDTIATAISNLKTTTNTAKLLEQSQSQSEMLASQEEEMRQNMEEMLATQEEQEDQKEKSILREENLNLIINNIPECILTIDMDGNIKDFNSALTKLTKYKKEDLKKKSFNTLFETIRLSDMSKKKTFTTSLNKKNNTKTEVSIKNVKINSENHKMHLFIIQEIKKSVKK